MGNWGTQSEDNILRKLLVDPVWDITYICIILALIFFFFTIKIIKKAEHWRIDAFELWCWRVPKEIKSVNPKRNQSWTFIGRTDAKAETSILWPPDAKNWLTGKDPDAGTDWRWEEKGSTENEMVGWHHRLDRHEFEKALGVGDGQGSLVCCSLWACKESDMTERLNWTEFFFTNVSMLIIFSFFAVLFSLF